MPAPRAGSETRLAFIRIHATCSIVLLSHVGMRKIGADLHRQACLVILPAPMRRWGLCPPRHLRRAEARILAQMGAAHALEPDVPVTKDRPVLRELQASCTALIKNKLRLQKQPGQQRQRLTRRCLRQVGRAGSRHPGATGKLPNPQTRAACDPEHQGHRRGCRRGNPDQDARGRHIAPKPPPRSQALRPSPVTRTGGANNLSSRAAENRCETPSSPCASIPTSKHNTTA